MGWRGHDDDHDGSAAHGREESIWDCIIIIIIYGYDESSSTTYNEEDEDGRYDLNTSPPSMFFYTKMFCACVLFYALYI